MGKGECARCLRVSSHLHPHGEEQLCKKCSEHAEIEDVLRAPAEPTRPLLGRVRGAGGGVEGVRVGVKEVDAWALTDKLGAFDLGGALGAWLEAAAAALFEGLKLKPGGCEAWLRDAHARGDLPGRYETLLRSSDIGAALSRDAFVSLVMRREAAEKVAPKILAGAGRSSSMTLSFQKEGLAPRSLQLDVAQFLAAPDDLPVDLVMQRVAASGEVDPASGGSVTDPQSGASVTLPPGASFVGADGRPYEGKVSVAFSVIDATDPASLEAMPGDFSAVDAGGKAAQLESFGAMWVGLTGDGGAPLQLADSSPGMAMELFSSAPVNVERLGGPPSLWEFDEASGKWRQDASGVLAVDGVVLPPPGVDPATVTPQLLDGTTAAAAPAARWRAKGKARGKKIGGADEYHQLNHFDFLEGATTWTPEALASFFGLGKKSRAVQMRDIRRGGYWNCDAAYITTILCGRLIDAQGSPAAGANAWSVGSDYSGASPRAGVAEDGSFSILAQGHCTVEVYALLPSADGAPARYKFGPFKTGAPGATKDLSNLNLTAGKRSHSPPAKREPEAKAADAKELEAATAAPAAAMGAGDAAAGSPVNAVRARKGLEADTTAVTEGASARGAKPGATAGRPGGSVKKD